MDGNRGTMRFYAVATFVSCLLSGASNAGGWKDLPSNPVLGSADLGTCFDVNVVTNGPAPYTTLAHHRHLGIRGIRNALFQVFGHDDALALFVPVTEHQPARPRIGLGGTHNQEDGK